MSARSIKRAHAKRMRTTRRRAGIAAAAAAGAAATIAAPAQAATFEVNSLLDDGDGTCDATCTIRDAVETANLDAASDTITFAPGLTGTIVLINGELPIDSAMSIEGPGADVVRISGDANGDNIPDAGDSRIAYVDTDNVGAANEAVSISGLTLTEGYDDGNQGGAIYSADSNLTLDRISAPDNYGAEEGGAVYSYGGDLTITDSTVSDNYAEESGAVSFNGDPAGPAVALIVRNSTFSGNTGEDGGGIEVNSNADSVLIDGSTFSDNDVDDTGGAIDFGGMESNQPVIQNTTISGNSADDFGGGIDIYEDEGVGLRVQNSTIAGNTAGADGTDTGGGIYLATDGAAPVVLSSTIIADNTAVGGNDLAGDGDPTSVFTLGFSLLRDTVVDGATVAEDPGGSNLRGVDPQLGPLADNGGPTRTRLIAETSPAVDAGIANGLTTDQRGLPRTAEQAKANASGSDGTDIGSVELADAAVLGADATAKKKQKVKGKKVKVVVKAGADEVVDLLASGKVKVGKKSYKLKDKKADDVAAGDRAKLTLKPKSKKAKKKIAARAADGKKSKATVDVTFTDAAGNTDTDRVKVTLVGKKSKRK